MQDRLYHRRHETGAATKETHSGVENSHPEQAFSSRETGCPFHPRSQRAPGGVPRKIVAIERAIHPALNFERPLIEAVQSDATKGWRQPDSGSGQNGIGKDESDQLSAKEKSDYSRQPAYLGDEGQTQDNK